MRDRFYQAPSLQDLLRLVSFSYLTCSKTQVNEYKTHKKSIFNISDKNCCSFNKVLTFLDKYCITSLTME